MTSLPDRPDLRQLRTRAKELKRAFEAGDHEAIARVLASHPNFAGRPAERLEGWRLTLRDAQVTIARELGFDSWKAVSAKIRGAPRWDASTSSDIARRAFAEAQDLRHRACIDLHFLLALLKPPAPTRAAAVLGELGLTYADVRRHVMEAMPAERELTGISSSPTYQLILGWAQGIAIGLGAARLWVGLAGMPFTLADRAEPSPTETTAALHSNGPSVRVRVATVLPRVQAALSVEGPDRGFAEAVARPPRNRV